MERLPWFPTQVLFHFLRMHLWRLRLAPVLVNLGILPRVRVVNISEVSASWNSDACTRGKRSMDVGQTAFQIQNGSHGAIGLNFWLQVAHQMI